MNFDQTPEFQKDLKHLVKKWRSLPNDLLAAEQQIVSLYNPEVDETELREYRAAFFNGKRAAIIYSTDSIEVVKMRLDVAALGTSDKVRIVFVAVRSDETVTFVELYSKNEKEREDKGRIKKYL